MKVLLKWLDARGEQRTTNDRVLDLDRVRIGRRSDRDLQLQDMRLSLVHADIVDRGAGSYFVESRTRTGVWVNGSPAPSQPVKVGDHIDCGRFRITLCPPPPDVDLCLEIVERVSAREEKQHGKDRYRMRLTDTGLRMRRPAVWLALLVLIPGLLLPLALRYAQPVVPGPGASFDLAWQTGPASSAHRRFIGDCSTCHQRPFESVRNDACGSCHTDTAHHSESKELQVEDGLADARCGSCHLEHSGSKALAAHDGGACIDCHASPKPAYANAGLLPASGFSRNHPPFSLRIAQKTESGSLQYAEKTQEPGAKLVEAQSLTFSHAVHLDRAGLRGPDGTAVLNCASCHAPTESAAHFRPISMEAHCSSCHRLDFDPDTPQRLLPHAKPDDIVRLVSDFYARQALAGEVQEAGAPDAVRLRRIPGVPLSKEQSRAALDWADERASRVLEEVFETRVCSYCHTVTRTTTDIRAWTIAPVAPASGYFNHARFNHAAHKTETCESCHAASQADSSAALMIPDLASCRGCHGDPGERGKVESSCTDCHGFHTAAQPMPGTTRPRP